MSALPPIIDGHELSEEQKRLLALVDELRKGQLTFMDEAGKRIIELCTGLIGVLFAVLAFGGNFPPPYLAGSPVARALAVAAVLLLLLALLVALYAVQPRRYDDYPHNLTRLGEELKKMMDHKVHWVRVAGGLFYAGCLALALLVVTIILF